MSNRHEKTQNPSNVAKGRFFLRIFKILHFSRFLKIISTKVMLKSLKSFRFLAEHGRKIAQNWINSFCDDRYLTTAAHFRFQC